MGYLPEALSNYMALLGWAVKSGENEIQSLDEISKKFHLSNVNKSGAKFNWEKLNWINSQYIKKMEVSDLNKKFMILWKEKGWEAPSKEWEQKLTLLLQDSIIVLKDVFDQSKPFFISPEIQTEGINFLKSNEVKYSLEKVLESLLNKKKGFDRVYAKELIKEISKRNNIKKGILMKSLRVAFFGCLSGPDLIQSWELFSINGEDIPRIKRTLDII